MHVVRGSLVTRKQKFDEGVGEGENKEGITRYTSPIPQTLARIEVRQKGVTVMAEQQQKQRK